MKQAPKTKATLRKFQVEQARDSVPEEEPDGLRVHGSVKRPPQRGKSAVH